MLKLDEKYNENTLMFINGKKDQKIVKNFLKECLTIVTSNDKIYISFEAIYTKRGLDSFKVSKFV